MADEKKDNVGQDQSRHSGGISLMSRDKYVIEADAGSRKEVYEVRDEGGNILCPSSMN
jgi:hypothetical protein